MAPSLPNIFTDISTIFFPIIRFTFVFLKMDTNTKRKSKAEQRYEFLNCSMHATVGTSAAPKGILGFSFTK